MRSYFIYSNAILMILITTCYLNGKCYGGGGEDIEVLAPMQKSEKEGLYLAIQGFVGLEWNGSDLYPDPCGWTPIQGVSCDLYDGFWYVTALNIGPIHDNSLACSSNIEFRPNLFQLQHLKALSFFNCINLLRHHQVTIPTQNWVHLANSLESLEFRSNPGLIGEIPTSFGGLLKLESLVLIENRLEGELPSSLGNLISLKRLVLAGNSFTGRIPDTFGGLGKLLILDLSRNKLNVNLPNVIGDLASLIKLDLSNNKLVGTLPDQIGNLKNLTLLDLRNNKLSGGLSNSLQNLETLQELALSNNPIRGNLSNFEWQKLRNLVNLDLSNMGLTGPIPDSISELLNLRFLGLNNNNLTNNLSTKIQTLPSITAFYINGNNLTGELKFSIGFYKKMERRFGAWDNPNLCYPVEIMSTIHAPFGVKPCQNHVNSSGFDSRSKLGNQNLNQDSDFIPLESSNHGVCRGFMLEVVVLIMMGHVSNILLWF